MINYMDRQTLSLVKPEIAKDFQARGGSLDDAQYGNLERGFSWAFAVGAIIHGFLADRLSVRWYYPFVLAGWSSAGFATAFADNYPSLLWCRTALGFFESGQWPCALKTSQAILTGRDRTLGNGILQSGAALGAILTPQITKLLMGGDTAAWRLPFQIIGLLGLVWIGPWLFLVRSTDLRQPAVTTAKLEGLPHLPGWVFARRFAVLTVVVITINLSWHFLRAWLTPYLREVRDYDFNAAADVTTFYYVAADLGSLSVGLLVRRMIERGWSIHGARLGTFGFCALLVCLTTVADRITSDRGLNLLLLAIGFGALGVFPNYYTFSQELTTRHQGLLTGILSFLTWTATGAMQSTVGQHINETKSYSEAFVAAGLMPVVAFLALLLCWNWPKERQTRTTSGATPEVRV